MKKRNLPLILLTALLAVTVLACRPNGNVRSAAGTNLQIYTVKGVIQEVMPDTKRVKIAHEKITNYMEAMTMVLPVRDAAELNGLQKGDEVSFRMLVTDDDGWIDQIKKLGTAPVAPSPEPPAFRRVREVEPLAVGDVMPDYAFTNALGRVVRLSDFKGQGLVFTFIFTRCPFPTFCPRLSSSFSEVQSRMKSMSGGPTNWHLLSITIDPDFDTPQKLKSYADSYKADPMHWDFLTAELIDITAIGEQFGLQFWRANPTEPINHNVRTVVVDATGRIQWITNQNDWKSETLAEELVKAARAKPAASP